MKVMSHVWRKRELWKCGDLHESTHLQNHEIREFMGIVNQMKSNKSAGSESIPIEYFKYAEDGVMERIYGLIQEVWKSKRVGNVHHLSNSKKEYALRIESYRPISLLNIIYKIVASLVNVRVQEEADGRIGRYQVGFRKEKSVIY